MRYLNLLAGFRRVGVGFRQLVMGAVGLLSLVVASVASATCDPYGAIVTAASWTGVTADIIAIAALVAAVLVVVRGVHFLFGIIRR